jgi:hypothetical protein
MMDRKYYQISSPNIIYETIEGEVVIVDLDKGFYFSLRGTAAEIWAKIVVGTSVEQITQQLTMKYSGEDQEIERGVANLIAELMKENIIVAANSRRTDEETIADPQVGSHNATTEKFSVPVLEKYSDMADLLLLDPIHEVDETGWPNIPPNPDKEKL